MTVLLRWLLSENRYIIIKLSAFESVPETCNSILQTHTIVTILIVTILITCMRHAIELGFRLLYSRSGSEAHSSVFCS